ncbi:C-5 sterol desaturase [Verticillium alfalfae VaMs.102]|uniref:C-5 sterol desaturase n=1 Tax=Verticillium alfalfae (strain VaMs.102 / ATCC MYA-4576 / FGSC 10136) TaxID=526221 RepID=C9SUS6_VERA1|nr:C-5 sterol desaturase [Verticillium alfalfae VaMs.102]EEY22541.1 C-5 sterol desaturase [Verticillium alfalfae VaMs.102]
MDIVLEIADTFAADHLYAWLLPARQAPYDISLDPPSNITSSTLLAWQYKPATRGMYLEPTDAAFASWWNRDNIVRQLITLYTITVVFGFLIYFIFASLSYVFIFDKKNLTHPKFLKDQIRLEMMQAIQAMPVMALFTAPMFVLEVRGYARLYDTTEEGPGRWYDFAQFPVFILLTDLLIYWIHRGLHHPTIYKRLHKGPSQMDHAYTLCQSRLPPTGWFRSVFSLSHCANGRSSEQMGSRGAVHIRQLLFTTLWDRWGGSYRKPDGAWFDKNMKMSETTWRSGIEEMEAIQKQVEGEDDRTYSTEDAKKTK